MHYGPLSKACARVTTPAVVFWAMYTSHVEFENMGGLWLRGQSVTYNIYNLQTHGILPYKLLAGSEN